MVRKSASTSAPTTSAPVPAQAPVAAPVADAASKKTKKSKVVVETPATPVAEEDIKNEVSDVLGDVKLDNDVVNRCVEFSAKLQNATIQLTSLRTEFKQLEKQLLKEIKTLQKSKGKKNKNPSANRKPSGFVKPSQITVELSEFLGIPVGVEMARTEVSKELNKYINAHNLKDPANGRNINPDAKLTTLLKLNKEDKLNYFNLQKYMKHHFIKSSASAAVAATA